MLISLLTPFSLFLHPPTIGEGFKDIMANLKLSYPNMMDVAVPANMVCGMQVPASKA
ncbi:hypothetical protein Patl1_04995 [Pistacia atlantica]|uniref:Uncharacterized protein n=1 Tax=Pistacia atlantica TaxID=434234 RepID=A0ACC1BV06_9ROSI|nr:hypothetical protein Patl1_04995 [Pistacia atlantica]